MNKDKNVAILADTWYINHTLVGEDVTVTLPSIEWLTQSIKAGGNIDIPLYGLTDAIDTNVTNDGEFVAAAVTPGTQLHEFRWVKTVVNKTTGDTEEIGCKAFLKLQSKNIPEIGSEPQEAGEGSYDFSTLRYQLYENGVEKFLYDKLTGDLRIDSKDYGNKLKQYL